MDSIEVIIAIAAIMFFAFTAVSKAFKMDDKAAQKKVQSTPIKESIKNKHETFEDEIIKDNIAIGGEIDNKEKINKVEKTVKPINKHNSTHNILTSINSRNEAKKAFIYSEIFNRKY